MQGELIKITLKSLREHLDRNNGTMDCYSGQGSMNKLKCSFNDPVLEEEISSFEKQTGFTLPIDYKNFLRQCNGCSLFDDLEYGGESYLLRLNEVREYYKDYIPKEWFVIGYFYEDLIIIDLKRYSLGNANYLLVNDCCSSYEDAVELNSNFEIWFDRVIITQGSKFWTWKGYTAENYYRL